MFVVDEVREIATAVVVVMLVVTGIEIELELEILIGIEIEIASWSERVCEIVVGMRDTVWGDQVVLMMTMS